MKVSETICFHLLFVSLLYSPKLSTSISSYVPISFLDTAPHSNSLEKLTHLASTSLARARRIKSIPQNAPSSTTPLFPYSGAYSVSLSFGTPPQTVPMIMDTGSAFSWFPCTTRYMCKNCQFPSQNISSFVPKKSSSAKILGCKNPKCGWVHKSFDPNTSCRDCQTTIVKKNCTQICPPYSILYGSGSTGGVPMVETVNLPNNKKVPDFLVGCSVFSSEQPAGIAGFSRGNSSFPSQLGLKKFSYCLVSHKYDQTRKSSSLYMDSLFTSGKKTVNFSYTPLLKNPFSDYYYVGLREITVGGRKVEVSYEDLSLDYSSGVGGTVVDSGSTFTYMNKVVFNAVANAFSDGAEGYKRDESVEGLTGLRPCFDVGREKSVKMPGLKFRFKGGVEVEFPLDNYFFYVDGVDDRKSIVCLAMVTENTSLGPTENSGGPSVILGNFLMQGFGVEYDLRNERFGFRRESC